MPNVSPKAIRIWCSFTSVVAGLSTMPLSHMTPMSVPVTPYMFWVLLSGWFPVTQSTKLVDALGLTGGGGAASARAIGIGAAAASKSFSAMRPESVTFSAGRPASALKKLSNSRRAKASRPQINGGAAGSVGEFPASGFSTKLTTLDTRLTAAVNRSGVGAGVLTGMSWAVRAAIIGERFTGPEAARARASTNATMSSISWLVEAGSTSDWTVRADEMVPSSTAVGNTESWVECSVSTSATVSSSTTSGSLSTSATVSSSTTSGSFSGTSAASVGSAVPDGSGSSVSVAEISSVDSGADSAGSAAGVGSDVPSVPVLVCALTCPGSTIPDVGSDVLVVLSAAGIGDPAASGVVEGSTDAVPVVDVLLLEVSVEVDGDESVVSAAATPFPIAMAVPTPNATANPPTWPI